MQKLALPLVLCAVLAVCFSAPTKQAADVEELLAETEHGHMTPEFAKIEQSNLRELFSQFLTPLHNYFQNRLADPSMTPELAMIEQNTLREVGSQILARLHNYFQYRFADPSELAKIEQETLRELGSSLLGPLYNFLQNRLNLDGSSVQPTAARAEQDSNLWEFLQNAYQRLSPQEEREAKIQQSDSNFRDLFREILSSVPRRGGDDSRQAEEMSSPLFEDADRQFVLDLIRSRNG